VNLNYAEALTSFESAVTHHVAVNNGVHIHYAAAGEGPLVVFVHGFPDHWLSWWQQMTAFADAYRVVAIDQRGFNLSDQPEEVGDYGTDHLVGDIRAVLAQERVGRATIIGHDWGGFVAWHAAMDAPELVERLVVLNMPHPWAVSRELAHNPQQAAASQYAQRYREPEADVRLARDALSYWVPEPAYRTRLNTAMAASSLRAMLNFYRANYPPTPYQDQPDPPPRVQAPTLCVYGLDDPFLLPEGLNQTWQWVDNEVTIVTIPRAGHFVHHDRPDRVTAALRIWLAA
jgi:pimeloyl-ACP methyl ester carboxylesterase